MQIRELKIFVVTFECDDVKRVEWLEKICNLKGIECIKLRSFNDKVKLLLPSYLGREKIEQLLSLCRKKEKLITKELTNFEITILKYALNKLEDTIDVKEFKNLLEEYESKEFNEFNKRVEDIIDGEEKKWS